MRAFTEQMLLFFRRFLFVFFPSHCFSFCFKFFNSIFFIISHNGVYCVWSIKYTLYEYMYRTPFNKYNFIELYLFYHFHWTLVTCVQRKSVVIIIIMREFCYVLFVCVRLRIYLTFIWLTMRGKGANVHKKYIIRSLHFLSAIHLYCV